jgi:ABC-2 type transport system ATP-binding protein
MQIISGPMLGCRDVHHAFGGQVVLSGVDLTASPGRVYALVGRNGAGKSTLLKILLGLVTPRQGRPWLLGRPFDRSALSRVGAVVDGPALYGQLSARENLLVHARLMRVDDRRVDDLLALMGLAGTGGKPTKRFSTGMRVRLALAIALLTDPEVLVLDEPQNGLDPEGIVELRHLVRGLAAAGRTVLLTSHHLGEVRHVADDIGVLTGGRLAYQGPLADFAPDGDLEAVYFAATGTPPTGPMGTVPRGTTP